MSQMSWCILVAIHMPNAETMRAIEEVKRLKADPNKKTYGSFAELLEDLDEELSNE